MLILALLALGVCFVISVGSRLPRLFRKRYASATITSLKARLADSQCTHCGGIHTIACPRVKSLSFSANGQTIQTVEFWPKWDRAGVIFPDEIYEMESADGEADQEPAPA